MIRFNSIRIHRLSSRTFSFSLTKYSEVSNNSFDDVVISKSEPSLLTNLDDYRQEIGSIAKNLYRGSIDPLVLSYPNVLHNDRYYASESRIKKLKLTLSDYKNEIDEIDKNEKVSDKLKSALKDLGIFSFGASLSEGGHGLGRTETARAWEELSTNLSLSETLFVSCSYGYKALSKYGNSFQKKKYLSKLVSGELSGTLCVSDEGPCKDPSSCSSKALIDNADRSRFLLNGVKNWVINGPSADIFTVFANVRLKGSQSDVLTGFFIPKKTPGVSIGPLQNKIGLKGLETSSVVFQNVELNAEEHLLGDIGSGPEIFISSLCEDQRLYTSARLVAVLRSLLTRTITHTYKSYRCKQQLNKYQMVRSKLSMCASKVYALESMIYLVCGLADAQSTQDFGLDATLTKIFANDTTEFVVETCKSILGILCYDGNEPYHYLFNDLEAYKYWDSSDDTLRFYASLVGLSYAGPFVQNEVTYSRNNLNYIHKNIKMMFKNMFTSKSRKFQLDYHVHLGFETVANVVEDSIQNFGDEVVQVLQKHGRNVQVHQVDLSRLAFGATYIYAMIATLSRASRSYCNGHEHSELEKYLALSFISDAENIYKYAIMYSGLEEFLSNDRNLRTVGDYLFDVGKYCCVHPMTKNSF